MEGLDGIDRGFWGIFFFPFTHFKVFFSDYRKGYGFGLSLPLLFCPSFTSHWEPEELELFSAHVPAQLGEGETTVCLYWELVSQWDAIQKQSLNICYLLNVSTHSKNTATIQNTVFKTLEEMNHPEIFQDRWRLLRHGRSPLGSSCLSGCLLSECLWFLNTQAWILLKIKRKTSVNHQRESWKQFAMRKKFVFWHVCL